MSLIPGMNGTNRSARLHKVMIAMTSTSPLLEVDMGGIWYHIVYSHSHGWPGQDPVSLITPH